MFGLANTLAALAPNIWVMAVARLIPALGLPVFWALASETAVDIVGPDYAGRAIAKIGFGIVCATVFGIPVGTLISDAFGWRSAFGILALVAFAKALLLYVYLPQTRVHNEQASLRSQFGILRSPLMQGMCCCRSWCSVACSPPTPTWRTSSSAWPVSTARWSAGA